MKSGKTCRFKMNFIRCITGLLLLNSLEGCISFGALQDKSGGIGWGGRTIAVAVDPTDDTFLIAASPTGGLFDSAISGAAWGHIDALPEFGLFDVKFSPSDKNVIIATALEDTRRSNGGGIWLSSDHGKTWAQPLSSIRKGSDGSVQAHSAFGIAFVPGSSTIYVGTDDGLAVSNDSGSTWAFVDPQPTAAGQHNYFAVLALSSGRVIAYGTPGLWVSDDGKNNWTAAASTKACTATTVNTGNTAIANALAVSPLNSNDLFFSDNMEDLYASTDGGKSWCSIDHQAAPTSNIRQPTLKVGPATSQSAFTIFWAHTGGLNSKLVKSGKFGLNYSGSRQPVNTAHSDPTDIAFSSQNLNKIFAANDGGVEASSDGGSSWTRLGTVANGYDAFQVYDVKAVLSTQNWSNNDVYFGTQDNNLYASNDNGVSWPGLVVPEGGRIQGPATQSGSAYTLVHQNDTTPGDQGSQRSGRTFENGAYIAFPFTLIHEVYFLKDQTFFAFGITPDGGTGIWESSTDSNGNLTTWSQVTGVDLSQAIGHFAFVSGGSSNPSVIVPFSAPTGDGLLRIDNAFTGKKRKLSPTVTTIPLPANAGIGLYGFQWIAGISSFAVDPKDPNFIILPDVNNNRVYITTDGGSTWTQRDDIADLITDDGAFMLSVPTSQRAEFDFELSNAQISAIAFDPLDSNRILIGTSEAGIVFSTDHGQSWVKIPQSESIPNITSFAFTQSDTFPREAFVSSWGRGIWIISLEVPTPQKGPGPPPPRPPLPGSERGPGGLPLRLGTNGTVAMSRPRVLSTVAGDSGAAHRLFDDRSPSITVAGGGAWLPLSRTIAGRSLQLIGRNWMPTTSKSEFEISVDGRPTDILRASVTQGGILSITLPTSNKSGRHGIEVRQKSVGEKPRVATAKFFVVIADAEAKKKTLKP
jgi:photosystem II stability/assembly factor-like uncharacterized protein